MAYGSLGIDVAIAVVTLISFNIYSADLSSIQRYLNIALTIEVVFTFVLIFALAYLYQYEKILDNLARFSRALTGGRKGKNR
ncbi:MAG: hypothetical protein KGH57_02935 [Candidatus Micrarchaeota archaeon]|nr:hypothetical protein [Candidatus Micrarchaeota archaeon]